MFSTKTKEHIRRRAAIFLPHCAAILGSLAALGAAVAFTGSVMRVVTVTDTDGARGVAITAAQDIPTLFTQTGVTLPGADDVVQISEEDGGELYHVLRAYTIQVTADSATQDVIVTGGTVDEALAQVGITYTPDDELSLPGDTPTEPGQVVTLKRITYKEYTKEEVVPVETEYAYSSLFYRQQGFSQVMKNGNDGLYNVSYRETYIDGVLTDTVETNRETLTEMEPTIVKCYGEKAPVSHFVGPEIVDGRPSTGIANVFTGQRATGYSASPTAKGSSGRRLTYGTVAINPNIIPYGSLMYITSDDGRFVYGYAYAADTGIAMMDGRAFIDLYYETYDESVKNAVIPVSIYVLDRDTAVQYKEQNDALLAADTFAGL